MQTGRLNRLGCLKDRGLTEAGLSIRDKNLACARAKHERYTVLTYRKVLKWCKGARQ